MTFTDELRRRVRERLTVCPTCGQPTNGESIKSMAERIGVAHTTLWRFLKGKAPSADLVDKLVAWLEAKET